MPDMELFSYPLSICLQTHDYLECGHGQYALLDAVKSNPKMILKQLSGTNTCPCTTALYSTVLADHIEGDGEADDFTETTVLDVANGKLV